MSNELKLSLENFQSISNGELEFKDGLNFIIGQSNSGKSATFRALKTCLMNIIGSQRFIKKGTDSSIVTLEYSGNKIIWKRTPKDSSYTINGEEYLKTGKDSALKILKDETGFVADEGNGYLMNIEEELQLPFPFGLSKTDLFKLYENVFCVSDSAVILKSARDHENGVKNECTNTELEINKVKNKLNALDELKKEVDINILKDFLLWLKQKSNRLQLLNDGLDIINKAIKASEIDIAITNIEFEDKRLKYKELLQLKKTVNQLKQLNNLFKDIPKYEKENLLIKYNNLINIKEFINKIKVCDSIKFSECSFENKLLRYNDLVNYLKELNKIKEQGKELQIKLKERKEYLVNIQNLLKQFKVCPLCHRPLED